MKRSLFVLTVALISSTLLPARAAAPASTPIQVVNTVVAASATLDTTKTGGLYAADAIFVDEGSPFQWNGANAGVAWSNYIKGRFVQMKMRNFTAIAKKPSEYNHTATGAYVIIPLVLNGDYGTKHFHEVGTFTFTLRREGAEWKITSQVWTVDP